jgi:hypothetical protein
MKFRYALEGDIDRAPATRAELRREVDAHDIEAAAEMAAEKGDQESGESPAEQNVWIEDPDSGEIVELVVYTELTPTYHATRY